MDGWDKKVMLAIQEYEEKGTLKLPMLLDEHERMLVARALARDETQRCPTCSAFIDALQALLVE